MTHAQILSQLLHIKPDQVQSVIDLLDGGNTLPFIARYRKEMTGNLDEEQIQHISEQVNRLRALDERRAAILKSIVEQDKLTPELQSQLQAAQTLTALEDLYAPYKPKRRTRASVAREKGLQGLADWILKQPVPGRGSELERLAAEGKAGPSLLSLIAKPYLNEAVPSIEEAWSGARDIVAETISDHADVRRMVREKTLRWGNLRCEKADQAEDSAVRDERKVYESYYDFEYNVERIRPHQVLAINRGETEKVLRVKVTIPERDWRGTIEAHFRPQPRSPLAAQMAEAIDDSAERLLLPAIERDVRRELTEKAEAHAIAVFAANLRALLSQPPLAGQTILGIDPGFRTGCKVAVVDATGKVLDTATIYPHEPHKEKERALKILSALVIQHSVTLISIGNGTASRETEQLAAELIQQHPKVKYLMTNEAGASVYSASPLARQELPELDVSMRGAVSIARRVQDPLAELVKIDPKSIGVGLYQHDVDQKMLASSLHGVVESVVNQVGVDANTASPALLTYVAGIGPRLAEKIVLHRNEKGKFKNRLSLLKVPGMGPKAFEQAAGFLRILDGDDPLDATAIHPESYAVAEGVMQRARLDRRKIKALSPAERLAALRTLPPVEKLAAELNAQAKITCGIPTLSDMLEQLARPGRDPRQDAPLPVLRSDVLKMEDLTKGMRLKGTVRNVVDFGVFVDIGVKQDGLLHRSHVPAQAQLKVGDVIEVEILNIEIERGRISLGM